jgi:CRP/FNR family transcriptional regulator
VVAAHLSLSQIGAGSCIAAGKVDRDLDQASILRDNAGTMAMGRPTDNGACGPHGTKSCLTCGGLPNSEWGVLAESDLRVLDQARIMNTYSPGQVIFYQGNPCLGIHCIESGDVALRKRDEHGNSVIVRLAHAGQTLGYRAFFSGEPYTASGEALTECRICFIDRDAVRAVLDHDHRLGLRFLQRATEELREAEEARLAAASLPVRARFAHLLLALKDRHGTVDAEGVLTIDLPLSRQDIAASLGTRPETVARTVRALEEDGIATFEGRTVRVQDLDLLLDEMERTGD